MFAKLGTNCRSEAEILRSRAELDEGGSYLPAGRQDGAYLFILFSNILFTTATNKLPPKADQPLAETAHSKIRILFFKIKIKKNIKGNKICPLVYILLLQLYKMIWLEFYFFSCFYFFPFFIFGPDQFWTAIRIKNWISCL